MLRKHDFDFFIRAQLNPVVNNQLDRLGIPETYCWAPDTIGTHLLCSESQPHLGLIPLVAMRPILFDLCDARGIPVLRIGVADNSGTLEILDIANRNLGELASAHRGTLDELFG